MRAAILAVGSELLGSDRVDTNSLALAETLAGFGIDVACKMVVGDEPDVIAAAVERLMSSCGLLLITGGLGPTQDDLTREAIAAVLGRPLERSDEILDELRRRFASFGIDMPSVNEKQADVIRGAEVLGNRRGTAPGMRIDHKGCTLFLFPGVPTELEGLVESFLVPWLAANTSGEGVETRVLKVACIPESVLEQRLGPFYDEWGNDGVSLLPSLGEVSLRLTTSGKRSERQTWLQPRQQEIRKLLGQRVFAESADVTLEEATGRALAAARLSVATAESCTGGLVGERLTRIPGSSRYFRGSVVSYANELKQELLQVSPQLLREYGAVSKEVAVAMAMGACRLLASDVAVAVTGVAGPDGGTAAKPVGTVHLAVTGGSLPEAMHRRLRLPGSRERVRWVSSQWALDMLRRVAFEITGSMAPDGCGRENSV
ncbi:MAG: competence/damage-inducible protein A [Acidobacteriota bacterium]|nr:competence/damage-inducible protein A [Acidobacteriota bacterium]